MAMTDLAQSSPSFPLFPAAICLPVFAGISIFFCAAPLAWHIKNRNLSCASLAGWIMLLNVFSVVNAIIWPRDNVSEWWNGVGLCDVEVKLYFAAWVAVPGCTTSILRNLARIMNTDQAIFMPSKAERRVQLTIELILCFGLPVLLMAVVYVIQFNRYYVFSIAGCVPGAYNSWVSIVLIFIWPPILVIIGAYYSVLLIVRMRRYRAEFQRMLESSNTNKSRFFRLFILATFFILAFVPIQIYILYENSLFPPQPFSWNIVHGPHWNTITFVPTAGYVIYDRWIAMGCAYVMFLFFGLSPDALSMYRSALVAVGLGSIFQSLYRSSRPSSNSSSANWSILSEKAKQLFCSKRRVSGSQDSFSHGSIIGSEEDIEKSMSGTQITTTLTSTLDGRSPSITSPI